MVFQLIGQWSLIVEATKTNKVRWRGKVVQEGKDRQGIPILNDCFSWRVEHRTTAFLMLKIGRAASQKKKISEEPYQKQGI